MADEAVEDGFGEAGAWTVGIVVCGSVVFGVGLMVGIGSFGVCGND